MDEDAPANPGGRPCCDRSSGCIGTGATGPYRNNRPSLHRVQRHRSGKEIRLNALLGGSDVQGVMLYLGSDVNILPKQFWEFMGKPGLVYSPI